MGCSPTAVDRLAFLPAPQALTTGWHPGGRPVPDIDIVYRMQYGVNRVDGVSVVVVLRLVRRDADSMGLVSRSEPSAQNL